MVITAVIFDMDGVIVDSEGIWDKATAEALKKYGKNYQRDILKVMCVGKGFRESCGILLDYYDLDIKIDDFIDERRKLVMDYYNKEIDFIPGFLVFFKKVKQQQLKTCVATASGQMFIDLIEKKLKIYSLFNNNIYSIADVNHVPKPDPAVFLFAAEQLGVKPEHCIVIEDSPNGIKAAKNAGMKCVALTTTFTKEHLRGADVIVDKYDQIKI
ncbi:HAD family phosphatase [Candidatus Woesearchaeota archaeon]|nr:HAD family phosphatase [Candidatus Woesearchaeota archaeon]